MPEPSTEFSIFSERGIVLAGKGRSADDKERCPANVIVVFFHA
jgi:hypothetical protein